MHYGNGNSIFSKKELYYTKAKFLILRRIYLILFLSRLFEGSRKNNLEFYCSFSEYFILKNWSLTEYINQHVVLFNKRGTHGLTTSLQTINLWTFVSNKFNDDNYCLRKKSKKKTSSLLRCVLAKNSYNSKSSQKIWRHANHQPIEMCARFKVN